MSDVAHPAVGGVEGHHAQGIQHQIHGAVLKLIDVWLRQCPAGSIRARKTGWKLLGRDLWEKHPYILGRMSPFETEDRRVLRFNRLEYAIDNDGICDTFADINQRNGGCIWLMQVSRANRPLMAF